MLWNRKGIPRDSRRRQISVSAGFPRSEILHDLRMHTPSRKGKRPCRRASFAPPETEGTGAKPDSAAGMPQRHTSNVYRARKDGLVRSQIESRIAAEPWLWLVLFSASAIAAVTLLTSPSSAVLMVVG